MKGLIRGVCCFLLLGMALEVSANSDNSDVRKNLFHYQMFCQGCHVPDGRGGKDVPDMRHFIGNFLTFQEGREYLIRVPGSANSALNDADLASLMNWMVVQFGKESVPDNFEPYTAEEVGELRQSPLMEVLKYRQSLVRKIESEKAFTN